MKSLRILQVSGTGEGGAWFTSQVLELASRGHYIEVVVPARGSIERMLVAAGLKVHVIAFRGYHPRDAVRLSRSYRALRTLILESNFDLVHAHLIKAIILCRTILLRRPRPRLVSQTPGVVHLERPLLHVLDKATLGADDLLLASCTAFAERYRTLGSANVAVSYYGCDTSILDPTTDGSAFRATVGLDSGQVGIGMVAHMYPTRAKAFREVGIKGHETFIDAARIAAALDPNVQFFIIGDEWMGDGSYRQRLMDTAKRAGLDQRIRFLGHRDDMEVVLAGLDILVNPSLSESASYTMIEASLMEKPVIATRVGGLTDTVIDGVTGLLVPARDAVALSTAMLQLASDPARRLSMGSAGRSHVRSLFDISRTVDSVEEAYADVMRSAHDASFGERS